MCICIAIRYSTKRGYICLNLAFRKKNGRRKRQRGEARSLLSLDMVDMTSKRSRANVKRQLTNAIRKVSDALTVGEDVGEIGKAVVCMEKRLMISAKPAVTEDDIEECMIYFHEAETQFLSMKDRVAFWKESARREVDIKLDDNKIRAEDSVSQTKSRRSMQSKYSRSSCVCSLDEAMVRISTKRASLLAEASIVESCQSLANEEIRLKYEEMRLNQLKRRLELETEIPKVEAEEKACTDLAQSTEKHFEEKENEMVLSSMDPALRRLTGNETLLTETREQFSSKPLMVLEATRHSFHASVQHYTYGTPQPES